MRLIATASFILALASLNGPAAGMFGYGRAILQAVLFIAAGIAAHIMAEIADHKKRLKRRRKNQRVI